MRKAELSQELRLRNLNYTGTRQELIPRLLEVLDHHQQRKNVISDDSNGNDTTTAALMDYMNESSSRIINQTITGDRFEESMPPLGPRISDDDENSLPSIPGSKSSNKSPVKFSDNNDDATSSSLSAPSDAAAALETVQSNTLDSLLVDANSTYILRVKGQSRISAGGTGVGILLFDHDHHDTILTARKYLHGDRSLSLAEFSALVLGLKYAIDLGVRHVLIETDNDVMVNQLNGIFPVTKENLKPLYWRVMDMKESILSSFHARLIKNNQQAEELAKKALATCKSLNMTDPMADPMGKAFSGLGKQTNQSAQNAGTIRDNNNDMEEAVIDPDLTYLLHFDGGARGNPKGEAGCGMVLYDDEGTEVWCGWKHMEPTTNNRAEYHALLLGLKCARSLGIRKLHTKGDSDLVVKQINGQFQVKDAELRILWGQAKEAILDFEEFDISFVPRAMNRRADWLANNAMDTKTSHGFEEV